MGILTKLMANKEIKAALKKIDVAEIKGNKEENIYLDMFMFLTINRVDLSKYDNMTELVNSFLSVKSTDLKDELSSNLVEIKKSKMVELSGDGKLTTDLTELNTSLIAYIKEANLGTFNE
jgi:hypothetical protein